MILAEKIPSEATPIPDVGPDGGVVGRRGMWREEGPREGRTVGEKEAQLARWKDEEEEEVVVKKAPGAGDVGSEVEDPFLGRLLAEAAGLWKRIEARERPKQLAFWARLEADAADGQRVDSVVSFAPEI